MRQRKARVVRKTKETNIDVEINFDRSKPVRIAAGVGFFDHMLELFACHGNFSLKIKASGDVHVDDHHLIEDLGITIGQAFL